MNNTETVYDSIDLQLKAFEEALSKNLTLDELASPQTVNLLLQRQAIILTELRVSKSELSKLQNENSQLMDDREKLRISEARYQQKEAFLFNQGWIEIPISFLGGFAINLLAINIKDGLGWVLLILSLVILGFLRIPQTATFFKGR